MTTQSDNLIPFEALEQAAQTLRVLCHPHRLAICDLLAHQRVSVAQVAEHLNLPSNVVSQHLSGMKAHGLLTSEREGKTVYYRVHDPRPLWLLECIRSHQNKQR
jgi:ArsR family transcriptional regulator